MGWGGVLFIVAALFSTVIVEPVVVVRVVGAVDGDIAHLHTTEPLRNTLLDTSGDQPQVPRSIGKHTPTYTNTS